MTEPENPRPPGEVKHPAQPDLVEAIETLDHLIGETQSLLLEDAAAGEPPPPDEAAPAVEVPLLVEVVRPERGFEIAILREEAQQSFDDLFEAPVALDAEGPGTAPEIRDELGTLQRQLVSELREIIEAGLQRVADTARAAVAQELRAGMLVAPLPAQAGTTLEPTAPAEIHTLAQAVDVALSRRGLDRPGHGQLYTQLLSELSSILRSGLDQIRRNMDKALQSRLRTHAESTLRQIAAADARRQEPLWPANPLDRDAAPRRGPPG